MAQPIVSRSRPLPFRLPEIAAAAGIAAIVDVALWSGGPVGGGYGLALFFFATPLALFLAASAWRGSRRLLIVAGLLGLVLLRCIYAPTAALVCGGLGLLIAFTLGLRSRRLFVPDVLASAFIGIAQVPSRVTACARGLKKLAGKTRLGDVAVLPIVVPAGLVAVFLGVFALANPVVAHSLGVAWDALAKLAFVPSLGRALLWGAALVGASSLLRPAMRLARGAEDAIVGPEATPTSLLTARNALVGLNVLFLGYNVIDARFLWSGSPPSGMNTQAYAHQGAFWLTLALLMLTAVIGVMFRGSLAHDVRAKAARRLAYAWMAQGVILALGTYRRIGIHIAKSGLSDLRIVGILGTSLVVCGVVLVALKLRRGKALTWLVRRQLDALAVTTLLYLVAPTHLLSATVNVARIQQGEYRPILHTFRQSHEPESAAAFLPLLDHPDARVRQGIAALLADERGRLEDATRQQRSWRERDLATRTALRALDAEGERIERTLGGAAPGDARSVLFEISRAANEDRSLEELLAIPSASGVRSEVEGRAY